MDRAGLIKSFQRSGDMIALKNAIVAELTQDDDPQYLEIAGALIGAAIEMFDRAGGISVAPQMLRDTADSIERVERGDGFH